MASGFKKISGLAIIVTMVCIACLPEPLELKDVQTPKPKIVVSSQEIPGYPVAVLLTKSISALDGNQDTDPFLLLSKVMINDAKVQIVGAGRSFDLEYIDYGVYGTRFMSIIPGEAYTLLVNSPSMGAVSSTTVAKSFIPFEEVDALIYVYGRDTLATINYKFDDPIGENWYMLNAQQVTAKEGETKILNPTITTKVLSDAEFDGLQKSDTFKMLFDEVKRGDTIAVTITNIDKAFYDFMKLREDTRFGFAAVLGEPINYPSNVKNGLGYFTLFSPDRRVFTLKEYGNL